jgi:hypothetical protein
VILGHLIPAGTAFNPHLNLRIKHLAEPPIEVPPEPRIPAPSQTITTTITATTPRPEAVPQAGS